MAAFAGELTLDQPEKVISGIGTLAALAGELDRLGCRRAVIVTGRSLGGSPLLDRVREKIGPRLAAVFAGARQHVPAATIGDLASVMREAGADAVVSFGGGSPIDTAKGAIHAVSGDEERPAPVHLAIPTTLSAGEFTALAGVTDETTRVKLATADRRMMARVVIMDAELTVETPAWLWAASGVRALDHAVESIYSSRHHPFCDALASRAIQMLRAHLPESLATTGATALEHRAQCQVAAWMSVFGMIHAGFGLSHVLGHQIGPRWNVPHGITSCVTLPHAMRFMAQLVPHRFEPIAAGFGTAFDPRVPSDGASACADRAAAFIGSLNLPTRLQDVHVPREEVGAIAGIVHEALERAGAVDRPVAREEVLAGLLAAY